MRRVVERRDRQHAGQHLGGVPRARARDLGGGAELDQEQVAGGVEVGGLLGLVRLEHRRDVPPHQPWPLPTRHQRHGRGQVRQAVHVPLPDERALAVRHRLAAVLGEGVPGERDQSRGVLAREHGQHRVGFGGGVCGRSSACARAVGTRPSAGPPGGGGRVARDGRGGATRRGRARRAVDGPSCHAGRVPEGDVVRRTALRLDAALSGQVLTGCDLRWPCLATVDLTGRTVLEVVSGQAPAVRGDGDPPLTLHSHLRMEGSWHVHRTGEPFRSRPASGVRAVLETATWTAVGHKLGMLDLVAPTRSTRSLVTSVPICSTPTSTTPSRSRGC